MRKLLVILLTVELLIAVPFGQGGFLHRHDFDHAFFAWHENPTLENRLELEKQRDINEMYRWGFFAIAFGAMALVTLFTVYTYGCRHRSEQIIQS